MTRDGQKRHGRVPVLVAAILAALACPAARGDLEVLGVQYRADEPFPEYRALWHQDVSMLDEEADAGGGAGEEITAREPLGASVHVLLRNGGPGPIEIRDIEFEGQSLTRCLAFSDQRKERKPASLYFANLPPDRFDALVAAGEPIWFKIDPRTLPPDGTGQVVVRLRREPQAGAVRLGIRHGAGLTPAAVPVRPRQPRLAGAFFSQDLKTIYLYFRRADRNEAPARILLDGRDVTGRAAIAHGAGVGVSPAVVRLTEPLASGSFHVFAGAYPDGQTAWAGLRAWHDDFAYGMYGGPPGKDDDETLARGYLTDVTDHNINTQMPNIGSPAVAGFLRTPGGRQFAAERGMRFIIDEPGKWSVERPFLWFIKDEPDCADPKMEGVPEARKVGLLAQWCVKRADELRQAGPDGLNLLNLDSTNKPHNWYVYGQLPDVLSIDPYYQPRLRDAVWEHPERMPLYDKATYVRAVAALARSACEPNPLHVILYACAFIDGQKNRRFPFPTPQSKRIELYYALANGAKGLSYWWYSPCADPARMKTRASHGVGAATLHGDPAAAALWREIGLLGAEARTAGPVLLTSCPAPLKVEATQGLWVRCLIRAMDTIVVLVVNDQYTNSAAGTRYRPISTATVTISLPAWLAAPQAFEINARGTRNVAAKSAGGALSLNLGRVDLTRLVVATSDPELRSRLQQVYDAQFKSTVSRLLTRQAARGRRAR